MSFFINKKYTKKKGIFPHKNRDEEGKIRKTRKSGKKQTKTFHRFEIDAIETFLEKHHAVVHIGRQIIENFNSQGAFWELLLPEPNSTNQIW